MALLLAATNGRYTSSAGCPANIIRGTMLLVVSQEPMSGQNMVAGRRSQRAGW
jgi:hypothetical protein